MSFFDLNSTKIAGDYLRYITLLAIKRANSGHIGLPLGCAEIGIILYRDCLRFSPKDPLWINRDRFVLSAGHGSMLLYALNYLFMQNPTLDEVAFFRQINSCLAGHPEYDLNKRIETSTGPLGQGFANAVGIALESKMLQARFNEKKKPLFDYQVYTLVGDGCLMEGVSYESASLAGHLKLDNLIAIYDDNKVTIDGNTVISFSEDISKRFEAMGWVVQRALSTNLEDVYKKLSLVRKLKGKPKILILETKIGEGIARLESTHKAHASIPSIEDIADFVCKSRIKDLFKGNTQQEITLEIEKQLEEGRFLTHENLLKELLEVQKKKKALYDKWQKETYGYYEKRYSEKIKKFNELLDFDFPKGLKEKLQTYQESKSPKATREIAADILKLCATNLPQLIGGAADLVASTKTIVDPETYVKADDFSPRNIAFGVREHAMGAISNGLALNRTFIPFTSTFFSFFDYMKPAVRLAALMHLKHLFIFTHDSFYVGEDGPTHQPIEQLFSIRLIPNFYTFRPFSAREMALSYLFFLEHDGPVSIIATRHKLKATILNTKNDVLSDLSYASFKKGAYILQEDKGKIDIVLLGSGSEVELLLESRKLLNEKGKAVRLISAPCLELFQNSDENYQKNILGKGKIPVLICEAASYPSFKPFLPSNVCIHSVQTFGKSGKDKDIAKKLDFTPEAIYKKILNILNNKN